MIVAVMSQPLRSKYSVEFVNSQDSPTTLVVGDEAAVRNYQLADGVHLVAIVPPPPAAPSDRIIDGPFGRRLARIARAEGKRAARLLRLARRVQWKLRYLDRLAVVTRSRSRRDGAHAGMLADALTAIDRKDRIERIVAFDALDLPVLLEFARPKGVKVLLR